MSEGRKKNRKSKLEVREDCDYDQQQSEPDLQRYLQLLNADHDYFSRPSPLPEEDKPIQLAVKVEVEEFDSNSPYDEMTYQDSNTEYYNYSGNNKLINKGYCRRISYSIEKILQTAEYTVSIAPSIPNKILNVCLRNLLGSYLIKAEDIEDPYEILINSALKYWPAWYRQSNTRDTPLFYQCYICNLAWWYLQPLKDHVKEHNLLNLRATFETDGDVACIVVNYKVTLSIQYIPIDGVCHQCGEDFEYHNKHRKEYKCKFCLRVYPTCGYHKQHEGKCIYRNKAGQKFCVICHQHIKDEEIKNHFINMHIVRSDLITPISLKVCMACNQVYHCYPVHRCSKSVFNTSCSLCCRKFATKKLGELHETLNLSNIFCGLCNTVLTKKCTEMEHMFKHTDMFKMVYKCIYCNDIFVDDESIRLHRMFNHRLKNDKKKSMLLTIPIPETCLRDDAIEIIDYTDPKIPDLEDLQSDELNEENVIKTELQSDGENDRSPDDYEPDNEKPDISITIKNDEPSNSSDNTEEKKSSRNQRAKRSYANKRLVIKKDSRPKQKIVKPGNSAPKILEKNAVKQKREQKKEALNKLNVQFDDVALEIDAIKIEMDVDFPNTEQNGEYGVKTGEYGEKTGEYGEKSGEYAEKVGEHAEKLRGNSLLIKKDNEKSMKIEINSPKSRKMQMVSKNDIKGNKSQNENETLSNVFKVSPEFQKITIKTEPADDIDIEEHVIGNRINKTSNLSPLIESVTVKEEDFALFEQQNMIKTEPDDEYDFSIDSKFKVEYQEDLNSSTEFDEPDSLYPCSKCDLLLYSMKYYLEHLVSRHSLDDGICPVCGEAHEGANLVRHFNRHVKNSFVRIRCLRSENITNVLSTFKCKHSCRVCHLTVNKQEFFSHWEKHAYHDKLKFEPREVKTTTVTPATENKKLSQEMLQSALVQLLSSNDKRDCCVCSRMFTRRADAKRHLIEHLLRDAHIKRVYTKSLRCQHCYEDFHKPDHYKFHMRDHGGLTIYRCELCQKTFSDSSNFTKHSKVHNVKVLVCDICKKKFNAKTSIERHIKQVHINPNIHPCQHCDRHFYTPSDLKRHERSRHFKTVSFKCHICEQSFKTLKNKWDHEWAMHNVRKYQADCPICKMSFRKFSDVKSHCRKVHNMSVSFKHFCGDSSRYKINDEDEICMIFENCK